MKVTASLNLNTISVFFFKKSDTLKNLGFVETSLTMQWLIFGLDLVSFLLFCHAIKIKVLISCVIDICSVKLLKLSRNYGFP